MPRYLLPGLLLLALATGCPEPVVDGDGDGFPVESDCDDSDPDVYPGAPELCDGIDNSCDADVPLEEVDNDADGLAECEGDCDDADPLANLDDVDGDGFTGCDGDCDDEDPLVGPVDADGDGASACGGDCDDDDPAVGPEAEELCDGVDNDCDGELDEGFDGDGDGVLSCDGDCDDSDPTVAPGLPELCDGLDNDCDGSFEDEEVDGDGDGFTPCEGDCDDASAAVGPEQAEVCDGVDTDCDGEVPEDERDADADGFSLCEGDCADEDDNRYPGAPEGCDGIDGDCDGLVGDEEIDGDGDGFSPCDGDCDDTDPTVNAAADELCDGVDTDCNGEPIFPDEDDADGDGVRPCDGDCDDSLDTVAPGLDEICDGRDSDCDGDLPNEESDVDEDGFLGCADDCDDLDPSSFPGNEELCDGVDNDCDGVLPEDEQDGDGDGTSACAGDCEPADPAVGPGLEEVCDGVDTNCDGITLADEEDADFDGVPVCAGDCDDDDPAIAPGSPELCDGVDNDCDGATDEAEDLVSDADGDGDAGLGCGGSDCDDSDPAVQGLDGDGDGVSLCEDDCDDADPARYPGATELCDGIDNDCDTQGDLEDPDLSADLDGDGDLALDCGGGDCDDEDPLVFAVDAFSGWQTDCAPLLRPSETTTDWDRFRVEQPSIIRDDEPGASWKLYYRAHDQASFFSFGMATSADGIEWEVQEDPIFGNGPVGSWDERGVSAPWVVYEPDDITNPYKMYYHARSTVDGTRDIGLAVSSDGYTWERWGEGPVLESGAEGSYDEVNAHAPAVIVLDGVWHLYYSARGGSNDYSIALATSTDGGYTWVKDPANPLLLPGAGWDSSRLRHPSVYERDDGVVEFWYSGSPTSSFDSTGYGWFDDLTTMVRSPLNPVMSGSGLNGRYDTDYVYGMAVVADGDDYTAFFSGWNEILNRAYVGVARNSRPGLNLLGPSTVTAGAPFSLEGEVLDSSPETVQLQIESDLDGVLATPSVGDDGLWNETLTLSVGTHQITVEAIDLGGLARSEELTISAE